MKKRTLSQTTTFTGFRRDKKSRERRNFVLASLTFLLILGLLSWGPFSRRFGGSVAILTTPVFTASSQISQFFSTTQSYFMSKSALRNENDSLRSTIEQQQLEVFELAQLREENAELRAVYGRLPDDKEYVLARVLASPLVSPYDTLLIDLGIYEGVGEGMLVYYEGGFAIGVIETAYRHSALVALYSRTGNELPVYVGTSSLPAIAHGVGGGNFRISLPKGVESRVGDAVSIPAFSASFVGVVDAIDAPENTSFATLYVKTPFNYQRLRSVYVAIPSSTR